MSAKRVTLKEVGERAKVSPMTASRVLNRLTSSEPLVRESTRLAVLEAAKELGYTPDGLAQAMRTGRTGNVGVILPRRAASRLLNDTTFYALLIDGLQRELLANEHNVLISMVTEGDIRERRLPRVAAAHFADALIFLGIQDPRYVEAMFAQFGAVVGLDTCLTKGSPCAFTPHAEGGAWAARHLWDRGHRIFAAVADRVSVNQSEGMEGFQAAVRKLGGQVVHVARSNAWGKGGYRGMREILQMRPLPTAVFFANDHLAVQGLTAVQDAGMNVPGDISFVGFDNIEISAYSSPPLTTFDFDKRAMGAAAAKLALHLLTDQPLKQDHVAMPLRLIERQSVRTIKAD